MNKQMKMNRDERKLYYTYLFMHFHVKPVGHFVILNVEKTRINKAIIHHEQHMPSDQIHTKHCKPHDRSHRPNIIGAKL